MPRVPMHTAHSSPHQTLPQPCTAHRHVHDRGTESRCQCQDRVAGGTFARGVASRTALTRHSSMEANDPGTIRDLSQLALA
jgi:hypothetical protein